VDDFFAALLWPLALCLLLAGLHTYLGFQVLARRVIFADLALAQIAGLGAVWGVMLGWSADGSPWSVHLFALAFTLAGAALLAGLGTIELPREALAAASYAVAAAGTILVGSNLHHGPEEVRDLLAGTAIWVRPDAVLATAALYAFVGAFLFKFSTKLRAPSRGRPPVLWQFAFYAALGLAVGHAVPLVGVLLVFAYLLLPAATGTLLAGAPAGRLRAGWISAGLATVVGVGLSYARDLPLEPTVVLSLGAAFGVAAAFRYLAASRDRLGASVGVMGGIALVVLALAWSFQLRQREEPLDLTVRDAPAGARRALVERLESEPELWERERATLDALLTDGDPELRARLLELIAERGDLSRLDRAHELLTDPDDLVREGALRCVRELDQPASLEPLAAAAAVEEDEFLQTEFADALLARGDARGTALLLGLMEHGSAEGARREAFRRLGAHESIELPYDPGAAKGQRATEVAALRRRLGP